MKYARELYKIGADAFIIQDLGLGKAIRDALPDMPIHLSTQATIYSREGAAAAKELGYSRVVLARELGLEEIRECSEVNETEVFIHSFQESTHGQVTRIYQAVFESIKQVNTELFSNAIPVDEREETKMGELEQQIARRKKSYR